MSFPYGAVTRYGAPFQALLVTVRGSAGPRSLATTDGVSVDVLSSGYLDVSVPRVCSCSPMYSGTSTWLTPSMSAARTLAGTNDNNDRISGGFPHSEIHGSKPVPGSPWLIAGYHVLHRLLLPRHPPNALFALDLIRKEQGRRFRTARPFRVSKASYFPAVPCPRAQHRLVY